LPGTIQGVCFIPPEYKFKTLNDATNLGNLDVWRTTNWRTAEQTF